MGFVQFTDFRYHVESKTARAFMVNSDLRYLRAVCTNGYSRGRRNKSRCMRHPFKVILIQPAACQISATITASARASCVQI